MKKLLLALFIFVGGLGLFWALRDAAVKVRREAVATRTSVAEQRRLTAEARVRLAVSQNRVRHLRQDVHVQHSSPVAPESAASATPDFSHLTAAQREQLLAELGLNWNTTGDYLIVSKDTLHAINFPALTGMKLTDTACAVLSITPEERTSIEAANQSLAAAYSEWAQSHAQREEPSGDVMASYTLPKDEDFSSGMSNQFTSGVFAALGQERGSLLLQYANSWMNDFGMQNPGAENLKVSRNPSGDAGSLSYVISRSDGHSVTSGDQPIEPFPVAFQTLFPNGWSDVAQREGFQLPGKPK